MWYRTVWLLVINVSVKPTALSSREEDEEQNLKLTVVGWYEKTVTKYHVTLINFDFGFVWGKNNEIRSSNSPLFSVIIFFVGYLSSLFLISI